MHGRHQRAPTARPIERTNAPQCSGYVRGRAGRAEALHGAAAGNGLRPSGIYAHGLRERERHVSGVRRGRGRGGRAYKLNIATCPMIQLLYLRAGDPDAHRKSRWLLLIHQIPPRPNYLRVKIGRRLQKLGAVAVKNSVYALPNGEDAQEQFVWVAREIVEGGGDASICESNFVGRQSNDTIEELFNEARARDFAELATETDKLKGALGGSGGSWHTNGPKPPRASRGSRRLGEILQLDFFGASGREPVEGLLGEIEARLSPRRGRERKEPAGRRARGARTDLGHAEGRPRGPDRERLADPPLHRPGGDSSSSFLARATHPRTGSFASTCSRRSTPTRVTAAPSRSL